MKSLMVAAMALALFASSPADAHAFLDHAAPAVGSTVHAPPGQVKIWFTQRLEAAFSSVQVFNTSGKQIDSGDSRLDPGDATLLLVSLPKLAPGTYKVAYRVLSVDTHVSEGDFTFDVAP
jgi:methionine-rich copper-binding protein CopC